MRSMPMTAVREARYIVRGMTPTHLHLRERLMLIFAATFIYDVIASVAIFFFERHAHGTKITTLGDSFFWTTTQLLTVSSQLPNPISTGGRILDIFIQFWAISIVATLAGSFGAFFNRRGLERDPLRVMTPTAERPPPGSPPQGGPESSPHS
jgi:hypothetical protein